MKIKNSTLAKAGLAFLCCISCSAFANYVTYLVISSHEENGLFGDLWFFVLFVIQVAAAVAAVVYGDILLTRGRLVDVWYSTSDRPDAICGTDRPEVVFITVDGCLFNGVYDAEDERYHGYDGLIFPVAEVKAWADYQITYHGKMRR